MKKKFLLSAVCFIFVLMSGFALSACGKEKACVHAYGDWIVTLDATCEEAGSIKHVCSKCDHEEVEEVAPLGHDLNYNSSRSTAKTCTTNGENVFTCSREGCTYYETSTVQASHNWDNFIVTCEHGRSCSVCDASDPALTHNFGEPEEVEATCEEPYSLTYTCLTCGHQEVETGVALGHEPDLENAHEAQIGSTCEYQIYYDCLRDGCSSHVNGQKIFKHVYTAEITQLPTCVAKGVKHYDCDNCDYSYDEDVAIDENAHNWVSDEQNGHTHKCSNIGCEAVKTVVGGSGTSHTLSEATENTEIKLDAASIMIDELSKYSASGDVTMSATTLDKQTALSGITDVQLKAQLDAAIGGKPVFDFAMTDENGDNLLIAGGGKTVVVKIPYTLAQGEDPHGILIWYIADDGTVSAYEAKYYEENGTGYVTFTTDHFSKYAVSAVSPKEVCEKLDHVYRIVADVPATCEEEGYISKVCSRCGEETVLARTRRIHHFEEKSRTEATCTTFGSITYECTHENCNHEKVVKIMPTGHNFIYDSGVEATCANLGNAVYKCSHVGCEETYTNVSGKLPHSYQRTVYEPTCEEEGWTEYVCVNCDENAEGHSYIDNVVVALGHDIVSVYHAHTFNGEEFTNGYTEKFCNRCHSEDKNEHIDDEEIVHTWNLEHANCSEPKYCSVCEFVQEEINVDAHQIEAGVCVICGQGCEHNMQPITIDSTCTKQGYKANACSVCGYEQITETIPALGHAGDINCLRCGYSIINVQNFFENGIDMALGGEYALYIDKLDLTGASIGEAMSVKVSLAETYVVFEPDGKYYAQGTLNFLITETREGFTVDGGTAVKFALRDGVFYGEEVGTMLESLSSYGDSVFATNAIVKVNNTNYIIQDLNNQEAFEGSTVSGVLSMIGKDVLPKLKEIVNTSNNKQILVALAKIFANDLFDVEETSNGYVFTLSPTQLQRLNNDLKTLTVAEFVESRLGGVLNDILGTQGNGFDNLVEAIKDTAFGNKVTVGNVLDWFDARGIKTEDILALVDSVSGGEAGFDKNMITMIRRVTVTELIAGFAGEEVDLNGIEAIIDEYVEMFKQVSAYELIAQFTDGNAEEIYGTVDSVVSMLSTVANVELIADAQGKFEKVNAKIAFEMEDIEISLDMALNFDTENKSQTNYSAFITQVKNAVSNVVITKEKLIEALDSEHLDFNPDWIVADATGRVQRVEMPSPYDGESTNIWDFTYATINVEQICKYTLRVNLDLSMTVVMQDHSYGETDNLELIFDTRTKDFYISHWNNFGYHNSIPESILGHSNPVEVSRGDEPETCEGVQKVVYYCRDCEKTFIEYSKLPHTVSVDISCEGETCADGVTITYSCTVCKIQQVRKYNYGNDGYGVEHVRYTKYSSENGWIEVQTCACEHEFSLELHTSGNRQETEGTEYGSITLYEDGNTKAYEYVKQLSSPNACTSITEFKVDIYEGEELVLTNTWSERYHYSENMTRHYRFVENRNCEMGYACFEVCSLCGESENRGMNGGHFAYQNHHYNTEVDGNNIQINWNYCPCGDSIDHDVRANYLTLTDSGYYEATNGAETFYISLYYVDGLGTIAVREDTHEEKIGNINYVKADVFMVASLDGDQVQLEDKRTITLYSYETNCGPMYY